MKKTIQLRTAQTTAKWTSGMSHLATLIVVMVLGFVTATQGQQNGNYSQQQAFQQQQANLRAQQAYWETFNRETTPLYNAARYVQRGANGVINAVAPFVRGGEVVRQVNNQVQQYVQNNWSLPQRYGPPQSNQPNPYQQVAPPNNGPNQIPRRRRR